MATNYARNDHARAWVFPNGVAGCCSDKLYTSCLIVDALTQSRGDITRIECPAENSYGQFTEIDGIPGEVSRMTTTLTTRYTRNERSQFFPLFDKGCSFDLHVNLGVCQNPKNNNAFDKKLIFEDVQVTAFNTDPLIALSSGDRNIINESIDVSIGSFFEVLPLKYTKVNLPEVNAGTVVGLMLIDNANCGSDCGFASDGCSHLYAVTADGDFLVSENGGVTWAIQFSQDLTGVAPWVGLNYLDGQLWTLGDADDNVYWLNFDGVNEATAFEVSPLYTATPPVGPVTIAGNLNYSIIADSDGSIYLMTDASVGASAINISYAGTIWSSSASNPQGETLIGGDNGDLVFTIGDGLYIDTASIPVSVASASITGVWPINSNEWLIGTSDGDMWCTANGGTSWTQIKSSFAGAITSISMVSTHLGFATAGDRIYRTYDGGCTWSLQPDNLSAKSSAFDETVVLTGHIECHNDVNLVWAYGNDVTGPVVYIGS